MGIDPGTTAAVACLDLRGDIVKVKSAKQMGLSHVIEFIRSCGTPAVVASDVDRIPALNAKVCAKFGVRAMHPERPLSVFEKNRMTEGMHVSDSHQRDCLAAAIWCYNCLSNKLRKIQALGLSDKVAHLVIQGSSIAGARRKMDDESPKPKNKMNSPEQVHDPQRAQVKSLKRMVKDLRQRLEKEQEMREQLKKRLEQAKKRKKPKPLPKTRKEDSLRSKINILQRYKRLAEGLSTGQLLLCGVYPHVIGGLTLIQRRGFSDDFDIGFTSKASISSEIISAGKKTVDSKALKELGGIYYIEKSALSRELEREPPLESIIKEYRLSRA